MEGSVMTDLMTPVADGVEGTPASGLVPDGHVDPARLPLERVEAEICTLAGQIAAATCRFLRLLAEFDAREGWAGWQVRSCAQWLSWRCGIDLRTAREQVRVARSLAGLPRTTEAFAAGRLSYSKVRAVTRVATAETEADLVEAALDAPAAQVERLVRGLQVADDSAASEDRLRPGVQWRWDDDGCLVLWGRLEPADGARLLAGLTRLEHERTATGDPRPEGAASAERPDDADGSAEPSSVPLVEGAAPTDLAPALVAAAELACTTVDAPVHAPAAEVVLHVDADTLVEAVRQEQPVETAEPEPSVVDGDARPSPKAPICPPAESPIATADPAHRRTRPARLEDGPALPTAVLAMLVCDSQIQLSVDGPDGRTLDLGRRRRRPTRRQLVALWRRDKGCAVPGCGRTRFLHAHHVRPWALGGPTSLDNLVLLCGGHHRLLHHGAFGVVALGQQRFRFRGTDRTVVAAAPATVGSATAAHPDITPTTIEPDWDGRGLSLDHAVATYLSRWEATTAAGSDAPDAPAA
jgi:Domain of unknown function (DUF222)/HNH endonuclease